MLKQLSIIGNIGLDAVVEENNGNKHLKFTVAVNESYTKANGDKVENTDWVTVYYPGVGLKPYLNKGAKVFVQGKMRTTSYKSQKDGNYHVGISINANIVEPFEWKKNEQSAQPAQPVTTAHEPVPIMAGDNPNDDLPF